MVCGYCGFGDVIYPEICDECKSGLRGNCAECGNAFVIQKTIHTDFLGVLMPLRCTQHKANFCSPDCEMKHEDRETHASNCPASFIAEHRNYGLSKW